jgi:hypothetical protein
MAPLDRSEYVDVRKIATNVAARYIDKMLSAIEAPLQREWAKFKNQSVDLLADYIDKQQGRLGKVRNMFFERTPAKLREIYVQPELIVDDRVVDEKYLVSRLTHSKRTLVTGIAGIGKSLLLRHTFLRLCEADFSVFPIYLDCRETNSIYDDHAHQVFSFPSLAHILLRTIGAEQENFSFQQLTEGLKHGLFCILLDGLDEAKYLDDLSRQISYFSRQYPQSGMIVTSRPMLRPIGWGDFKVIRINPMDYNRMRNVVIKLPLSDGIQQGFLRTVTPELFLANKTILGIPLLVGILALTYLKNARISSDAAVFYEDAFNALFNRHDATKEGFTRELKSKLSYLDIRRILGALSALMYKDYKNTLDHYKILTYIANSAQLVQLECEPEDILHDIVTNICIIMKDGNVYEFIHRSFQEFFCAHFLLSLPRDRSLAMIKQIAKRKDAANLIYLLLSIDPGFIERQFVIPTIKGYLDAREQRQAQSSAINFFFHEMGQDDASFKELEFKSAYPEMFAIREALWRRDGKIDAVKELEILWNGLRFIEHNAIECLSRLKQRLKSDIIGQKFLVGELEATIDNTWKHAFCDKVTIDYNVCKEYIESLAKKHVDFDRDLDDLFSFQWKDSAAERNVSRL